MRVREVSPCNSKGERTEGDMAHGWGVEAGRAVTYLGRPNSDGYRPRVVYESPTIAHRDTDFSFFWPPTRTPLPSRVSSPTSL